jgi:hypothetical protein
MKKNFEKGFCNRPLPLFKKEGNYLPFLKGGKEGLPNIISPLSRGDKGVCLSLNNL